MSQVNGRSADLLRRMGDELGAFQAFERVLEDDLARYHRTPDDPSAQRMAMIALINGASFAREVPVDVVPANEMGLRVLELCERARTIYQRAAMGGDRVAGGIRVRIEYFSAAANAHLGRVAAWEDLERLESALPLGPTESLLALDTYNQVLALADLGLLPEGAASAAAIIEAIGTRIAAHLERYAASPTADIDEYRGLTRLQRFESDPAIAAALARF